MNSPRTKDRIVERGLNVLTTDGLSGVTLGTLAGRLDMSKSGLFAHFRSKEELELALLERSAELAAAYVIEPAMKAAEGLPRLKALVNRWLGWTTKAGLDGGCPVAAALFELDDVEGDVRARVAAMEAHWRALLMKLVRRAIEMGHLHADLDAGQFVWELCGIYLSHHVSKRFLRDRRADSRARIAFDALLERAHPTSRKEK